MEIQKLYLQLAIITFNFISIIDVSHIGFNCKIE